MSGWQCYVKGGQAVVMEPVMQATRARVALSAAAERRGGAEDEGDSEECTAEQQWIRCEASDLLSLFYCTTSPLVACSLVAHTRHMQWPRRTNSHTAPAAQPSTM